LLLFLSNKVSLNAFWKVWLHPILQKINLIKLEILFGIRVGRSLGGHMITNKISQENLIWDVAGWDKIG